MTKIRVHTLPALQDNYMYLVSENVAKPADRITEIFLLKFKDCWQCNKWGGYCRSSRTRHRTESCQRSRGKFEDSSDDTPPLGSRRWQQCPYIEMQSTIEHLWRRRSHRWSDAQSDARRWAKNWPLDGEMFVHTMSYERTYMLLHWHKRRSGHIHRRHTVRWRMWPIFWRHRQANAWCADK